MITYVLHYKNFYNELATFIDNKSYFKQMQLDYQTKSGTPKVRNNLFLYYLKLG